MYSDAYLNYYADKYVAGMLAKHGLTLEQYLANPQGYEHLMLDAFPLLKKQQEAVLRFENEERKAEANVTHLPRRNGAIVEPLHHHRHNRRRFAAFFRQRS